MLCFGAGHLIDRAPEKSSQARWICGINIGINIAILCFFKYFNFFSENLKLLFSQFGFQLDWFTLEVLLPVGISFYTFQAISYPIDVYYRKIRATNNFLAFTAFISFFPQLVAGPIERSTQLLPQFLKPRVFDYAKAVSGMRQILWGFFKKMVIADNCAGLANNIFADSASLDGSTILIGGLFFTFQIYGDFSGYSDIAIGTAKLFGINLMKNFNLPYFSQGISEFWRRWHISLNKWFIDYVYIPLGGSKKGGAKTIRNVLIVFALSGLWHGPDWTFVLWGVYNGLLVCISTLLFRDVPRVYGNDFSINLKSGLRMAGTFVLVVLGWMLFRSDNLAMAADCFGSVFSASLFSGIDMNIFGGANLIVAYTVVMIFLMMIVEYRMRRQEFALDLVNVKSKALRWAIYFAVLFSIMFFTGEQEKFIYFQF